MVKLLTGFISNVASKPNRSSYMYRRQLREQRFPLTLSLSFIRRAGHFTLGLTRDLRLVSAPVVKVGKPDLIILRVVTVQVEKQP